MEEEIFATGINVNKVRHLNNFPILISEDRREHLLLTGKNGSGKTSLLMALRSFFQSVPENKFHALRDIPNTIENYQKQIEIFRNSGNPGQQRNIPNFQNTIKTLKAELDKYTGQATVSFNNDVNVPEEFNAGDFLIAFFPADRKNKMATPTGVKKFAVKANYGLNEHVNLNFIQHLVNMKVDKSFARDDNDSKAVEALDIWFDNFTSILRFIFDEPHLDLIFDRVNYNFIITVPDRENFDLNTLSDGFSAIIDIVTELILRTKDNKSSLYNTQGIVLIDEIENHLHIDLQKKVLPFLTSVFPRIQFIISTHSPFILNSLENAVIYDLERKQRVENLSLYSYDAIVEGYFNADKYSAEVKEKVSQYTRLLEKQTLTDAETALLVRLKNYLSETPKYLSPELSVHLNAIHLKVKGLENG